MHLALWYAVLVCHQYDVCKNYVCGVYVGGYGGLSGSGLCVFHELCPVDSVYMYSRPYVLSSFIFLLHLVRKLIHFYIYHVRDICHMYSNLIVLIYISESCDTCAL